MAGANLDQALDRLQRLAAFGAPFGARVSAEIMYGQEYQRLVAAGEKPQIRKKYRGN
jgi:hypothetical protein